MFRWRGRRQPAEPLPPSTEATYVERFRGTEWDTGVGVATEREPASVSVLMGVLMGAFIFAVLVVLWLLLGS
ncbi:MAG TPA: hypothetical protein VGQ47_00645 [Candidatus Limnocylindrales bacterium]|jgi:hypothetical protein|nr:hypothetical protein [Candidatus Limnocylindrales bacterium]